MKIREKVEVTGVFCFVSFRFAVLLTVDYTEIDIKVKRNAVQGITLSRAPGAWMWATGDERVERAIDAPQKALRAEKFLELTFANKT